MSNGKAEFSRHVLRVGIAQICQQLGWHAIQKTPLEMLTDIMERYLLEVAKTSHRYCEQFGRTEPSLDDVALAFKYIGINMGELEEYLKYFSETVPGPKDLPKMPGASAARLNMPKPGSREAKYREESEDGLPAHLPIMHRDWVDEGPQASVSTPEAKAGSSGEGVAEDPVPGDKRPASPDTPASKKLRTLPEEAGHSQYEMTCVTMSNHGLLTPTRALGRLPDTRTPPVTARPSKPITHYIRSTKLPDEEVVIPPKVSKYTMDDDDYVPQKSASKKVTHPVQPYEAPKRGRPRKDAPKRIPKKSSSALLMEKFEERVEKKREKERLKEKKHKHREKHRDSSHEKYDKHHGDKKKPEKYEKKHKLKERKFGHKKDRSEFRERSRERSRDRSRDRSPSRGDHLGQPWESRPKDERTRNLVKTLAVRVENMEKATYHSSPLERVAPGQNQGYECSPRERDVRSPYRSPRPPQEDPPPPRKGTEARKPPPPDKSISDLEAGLRIRSPPPVSRVRMADPASPGVDVGMDSPPREGASLLGPPQEGASLIGRETLSSTVKAEIRTTPPASPSSSPSRSSRAPSPATSAHSGAPTDPRDPRLAPTDPRGGGPHGAREEVAPISLKIGLGKDQEPMVIKSDKERKKEKKLKKKDKEKKHKHKDRDRDSKEKEGKKDKSKKKEKKDKEKQKVPKLTFKLGGSSPSSVASLPPEEPSAVPKLLIKPMPAAEPRPATPQSDASSRPITPSLGPSRSPSRSPSPAARPEMSPIRFSPVEDSPVSLTAEMNLETLANAALQPGRTSRPSTPSSPEPSPKRSPKVSPRKKVYTSSSDDDDSIADSPVRPTVSMSPPRFPSRRSSSSDSSDSRSISPPPSPRKRTSPKKGPPPTKAQLKAVPPTPPKKSPGRPPKKSPGRPRKHPLPEPTTPRPTAKVAPLPRSPDSKKMKVMTETVGSVVDDSGQKIWICPTCAMPDDGSPMIGCDTCDDWYHWPCVDITEEPSDDEWFCPRCLKGRKKKGKRGRPRNADR